MDSNRREALKVIGSTAAATATMPAAVSATKEIEGIPEPIETKKIEEKDSEQIFRVEFENDYVLVRIDSNKTKRSTEHDEKFSHGKVYATKIKKGDEYEQSEIFSIASEGEEIIDELVEFSRTGSNCDYVGGDWSDYQHQLNGISIKFSNPVETIGRALLSGGVSAAIAAAGATWKVSVPAGVIAAIYIGLSGPYYYYGEMDNDRGCISGRCGFRTFQGRIGDGSVRNPSWSQFESLTDSEGSLPIHLGSP